MAEFDPKVFLKNITKTIKDYGTIQGERTKLMSDLAANQLKARSNFFWKLKEQQASPQHQYQQTLRKRFEEKPQGGAMQAPQTDVFAGEVRPQVRMGSKGYEMHYPAVKEQIYARIQAKKKREIPLTDREKKFEEEYLGIREKGRQPTHQQQINKANALEMLNRGDFKDRQEAEDYLIDELKIDITDPEVQQALEQYKVSGEEGRKGFFQKYPRKEKFGYTYEKREDGKWHRLEE